MFICKRCNCSSQKSGCYSPDTLQKLSADLALISVRTRLELIYLLKAKPHCVCDLEAHTGMSQSLISHHLADLETAGIITSKREGKFVDYSLTQKGEKVVVALESLLEK